MIIMYHRIKNKTRCCSIKRFEEQIKLAKKIGATLTFDDGLKKHYTVALPILKKYDMKGTFFIITNFEKQMADVHKIWLILDNMDVDKTCEQLHISDRKTLPGNAYRHDSAKIANLKAFLRQYNYVLDDFFYDKFDEQDEIEKMYMNWDEITELYEAGMNIGSHSHTHPALDRLSYPRQSREIRKSTNIIKKKIARPISFSYPHGAYNEDTIRLLKKYKYLWAVTVNLTDIFTLGRVDTCDLDRI